MSEGSRFMKDVTCRVCGEKVLIIREAAPQSPRFGSTTMLRKKQAQETRMRAVHESEYTDQELVKRKARMSWILRSRLEDSCRGKQEREQAA